MVGDFTVVFEFNRTPRRLDTPLETQWDFEELRNGFWLDAQHTIVREPRGVYWIPPSRIIVIEKRQ